MPRKQHTHHYIYKTTCLITSRFYIGMHSTSNLNDGYIGSGKRLWNSINKHGEKNHKVEILEFLSDRDALKKREREIVNEDLLKDPMCMNLMTGGIGGLAECYKNNPEKLIENGRKMMSNLWKDPEYRQRMSKIQSECLKQRHANGESHHYDWTGRNHRTETKLKMSEKAKLRTGDKNSQFGSMWVTNGIQSLKIKKIEFQQYQILGWNKGRKMK